MRLTGASEVVQSTVRKNEATLKGILMVFLKVFSKGQSSRAQPICVFAAQPSKAQPSCFPEGSAEQSVVFTVFTDSVELAFQSHCNFEGLVEQSIVFTVFSETNFRSQQQSVLFTMFLKAQPSKAWYLLCSLAQSSWLFRVTAIFEGSAEQSMVFTSFKSPIFRCRAERRT